MTFQTVSEKSTNDKMNMTSTSLERCRSLWGIEGDEEDDEDWWANLVRINVERKFFVADGEFPTDMALYTLEKLDGRASGQQEADETKDLLLSLCKEKQVLNVKDLKKSRAGHRHVELRALETFFGNLRMALVGVRVTADRQFSALFLEKLRQARALPRLQAPPSLRAADERSRHPRRMIRIIPEMTVPYSSQMKPSPSGPSVAARSTRRQDSSRLLLEEEPQALLGGFEPMDRLQEFLPAASPPPAPRGEGLADSSRAVSDKRPPPVFIPRVQGFKTDLTKSSEGQALDVWDTVIAGLLTDQSNQVALLYSANSRQSSVLRSSHDIDAAIQALKIGSGQASLFHQLLILIRKNKMMDRVRILPISTSVEGGDNVPGNIVDLRHIDEELKLISEYRRAGWYIRFIAAPQSPSHVLRVAGPKTYLIGGGISEGWNNTARVSVFWHHGKWEQRIGTREQGGMSQGDYVDLKLRGILESEMLPDDLNKEMHQTLVSANTTKLPRFLSDGRGAEVCSFYYPDKEEPIDKICRAPFLGNFFTSRIFLKAGNMPRAVSFQNAEAAFQALKLQAFTAMQSFSKLSGSQVFAVIRDPTQKTDRNFQGLQSNWTAMMHVLKAKFDQNNELKELLIQTEDAYLLEHKTTKGKGEPIWSDNCDGTGRNWLGLQLMLLRETYRSKDSGSRPYTDWFVRKAPAATPESIFGSRSPSDGSVFKNIADYSSSWGDWHSWKSEAHALVIQELRRQGVGAC